MIKKIQHFFPIILLSIIPTLAIWLPFFLRLDQFWKIPLPPNGMATIVSNYDGPLYLVVAKTLYSTTAIKDTFSFNLPVEYYAAHFPLFPLLIRLSAFAIGYPYSMLLITTLSSIFALYFFHKLISLYTNKENALFLTATFAIFPARWLIVRSVGSPEPLFVGAIIASIYYFQNQKYWPAAFYGVIAQLTKSPGILLFLAYLGAILIPKFNNLATANINKLGKIIKYQSYPVILIPLSLLALFFFYGQAFNDFFAYFHSGDNIHLFFPPFQIFNYTSPWVDTHWLEEIIFVYLIGALGLLKLIKQKKQVMASFVGVFFASILFVSHRDLIRYALPIIPFLYVAFADTLTKKEFKIALAVIIIPIYLFSLAFISRNIMPIANWSPFL
jgi:Gpi18-like mannosyltransferase